MTQQPPIPDHVFRVLGDMAVLCPDHKEGPVWHHREYHDRSVMRAGWALAVAIVSVLLVGSSVVNAWRGNYAQASYEVGLAVLIGVYRDER